MIVSGFVAMSFFFASYGVGLNVATDFLKISGAFSGSAEIVILLDETVYRVCCSY